MTTDDALSFCGLVIFLRAAFKTILNHTLGVHSRHG